METPPITDAEIRTVADTEVLTLAPLHKIERAERKDLFYDIRDELQRIKDTCSEGDTYEQSFHRLLGDPAHDMWTFSGKHPEYPGEVDFLIVNQRLSTPESDLLTSLEFVVPFQENVVAARVTIAHADHPTWNGVIDRNPNMVDLRIFRGDNTCKAVRGKNNKMLTPPSPWLPTPVEVLNARAHLVLLHSLLQTLDTVSHEPGIIGDPQL